MKRMVRGVRKSLRIDEMDGSISQPEISGFKDKAVGVGRKNSLRSQIALQTRKIARTHIFGPLRK